MKQFAQVRKGIVVLLLAAAGGASAQGPATVFVDDSVAATETLSRVPELVGAGNLAEADRVLQAILDREGDRVVASSWDRDTFVPVRRRVHEVLLASPTLLSKYRQSQEAKAGAMLASGQHAEVERTRLLTSAGFEAALRVAQEQLESGRFDAAGFTLAQLDLHPDRAGTNGRRAAALARLLAQYAEPPGGVGMVERWSKDAGEPCGAIERVAFPPAALVKSSDAFTQGEALAPLGVPEEPLAVAPLGRELGDRLSVARSAPSPWVLPSIVGDTVYTNDGVEVSAWDALTLVPIWTHRTETDGNIFQSREDGTRVPIEVASRQFVECSTVSVGSGIAVAVTGFAMNGYVREGDRRVHAFEAITGKHLWSTDPAAAVRSLEGATVRGLATIVGDTVVVGMGRLSNGRRVASTMLVGLDASRGDVKWVRPLASVGVQPYNRPPWPTEIASSADGVVYKADALGVIAAVEGTTGRFVWVRRLDAPLQQNVWAYSNRSDQVPWVGAAVIIDGTDLVAIEPSTGDIIRMERATGRVIARRRSGDLEAVRYLVRVGDQLAAVGATRVQFLPMRDIALGTLRLSHDFRDTGISGRAVPAGDALLFPVSSGVAVINAASPQEHTLVPLAESGHPLVTRGQLLVAGPTALHSFQSWAAAEPRLRKWIAERPVDPRPCLTYLDIAVRAGKFEGMPGVCDQLLAIVDADPADTGRIDARRKLYELLAGLMDRTRVDILAGRPPTLDPGMVDPLVVRLARSADTPSERAQQFLYVGWACELQGRAPGAAEAYQQILQDEELAGALVEGVPSVPARGPARDRLVALLSKEGYKAYEAFDVQASRELGALGMPPHPADLLRLARNYPLARATPGMLLSAGEALLATNELQRATQALGSAVEAARAVAGVSRQAQDPTLGRAAGRLVRLLQGEGRLAEAERFLARLLAEAPRSVLSESGGSGGAINTRALLEEMRGTLRSQDRRARIGSAIRRDVQVIAGWTLGVPRLAAGPGCATDQLPMHSLAAREVGVWAPRAEDGRLALLWSRTFERDENRPTFLRIDWDSSILFWPGDRAGPAIERVRTDGSTAWKSPDFDTLLPPDPASDRGPVRGLQTPIDGDVDGAHVLAAMSPGEGSAVLCRRSGKAVGIDLASGKVLWAKSLGLTAVYDITVCGEHLVAIGHVIQDTSPQVLVLDARTGRVTGSLPEPGGRLDSRPRFVRTLGTNVLIATEQSVVAWNPATAKVEWSHNTGMAPADAWCLGDWVLLMGPTQDLHLLDARTGVPRKSPMQASTRLTLAARDPAEIANRVVLGPDASIVIASMSGLVCYDSKGEMIGMDASGPEGGQRIGAIGDRHAVFVNAAPDEGEGGVRQAAIQIIELPGGRVLIDDAIALYDPPSQVATLDGRMVICAGPVTIVIDAPAGTGNK